MYRRKILADLMYSFSESLRGDISAFFSLFFFSFHFLHVYNPRHKLPVQSMLTPLQKDAYRSIIHLQIDLQVQAVS